MHAVLSRVAVVAVLSVAALSGCDKRSDTTTTTNSVGIPPPKSGGGSEKEKGKAAEGFPPADWTHKELASHLEQKGLPVKIRPMPLDSAAGSPAASFVSGKGESLVFLCTDEKASRERAGSLGAGSFSAGRFAFGPMIGGDATADRDLLKRIAAALK